MTAYYNEHDPYAAVWLRNLIAGGQIAPGDVDDRDVREVQADDLRGYAQCHFFAGLGGWSYALRLAGWADDRPVWTGSCPCQPFSQAGKRHGFADDRHLWPVWHALIRERLPATVFGEQVAAAIGQFWLDAVSADLEAEGYAVGAAVLGAHSVGAPHIRQRLWFVAHAGREVSGGPSRHQAADGRTGRVGGQPDCHHRSAGAGEDGDGVGNTNGNGRLPRGEAATAARHRPSAEPASWDDCVWLTFSDGKRRPIEPGLYPLAYGVPQRVGRVRAYGNAIVPQVAAAFITAAIAAIEAGHG